MSDQSKPGLFAKLRAKFARKGSGASKGSGSKLTQKQKQWINLGVGLILFMSAALIVSSMIGGSGNTTAAAMADAARKTPESIPLVVPGEAVNDRDRWMGNAGQQVASLNEQMKERERTTDDLVRRVQLLEQTRDKSSSPSLVATPGQPATNFPPATPAAASASATTATPAAPTATPPASTPAATTQPVTAAAPRPVNSPEVLAVQQRTGGNVEAAKRLPVNGAQPNTAGMPPGTPNAPGATASNFGDDGPRLIRVSLTDGGKPADKDAAKPASAGPSEEKPKSRHIGTYLPVSFARIRMIGGLDAPTGGQAQSNPLPVFLKIEDNAFLPNHFRSRVKDCFVVAAAYGDISSERAYIRTETLSCVTRTGQAIEVPLKGSVFGEDGKLGFRGTVATKQGQVLMNAAAAGIASGIGQGFSSKYTTFNTTPLGTSETIDNGKIMQAGLATGFGNAMDRLAKYWIGVAEKMFPVIEIDASRVGDLFISKGTTLEFPLDEIGNTAGPDNRARIDRSAMFTKGYTDDEE